MKLKKISDCEKELDWVIEGIDNLLENLGYDHCKFEDTRLNTTAYRGLLFKDTDGVQYSITFDVDVNWLKDISRKDMDEQAEDVHILRY